MEHPNGRKQEPVSETTDTNKCKYESKHTKLTIFWFMLTKEEAILLIFIPQPNCLCQLFMVDGFEGRVGGYAPPITIVKLVGGQNTLHHIAIFLL